MTANFVTGFGCDVILASSFTKDSARYSWILEKGLDSGENLKQMCELSRVCAESTEEIES